MSLIHLFAKLVKAISPCEEIFPLFVCLPKFNAPMLHRVESIYDFNCISETGLHDECIYQGVNILETLQKLQV